MIELLDRIRGGGGGGDGMCKGDVLLEAVAKVEEGWLTREEVRGTILKMFWYTSLFLLSIAATMSGMDRRAKTKRLIKVRIAYRLADDVVVVECDFGC